MLIQNFINKTLKFINIFKLKKSYFFKAHQLDKSLKFNLKYLKIFNYQETFTFNTLLAKNR